MHRGALFVALASLTIPCGITMTASAEESTIHVGAIDALLSMPPDVRRPPVALLIAGSGPTDRDGNGPGGRPATLKKLSEQLAARKIAALRYDKRGSNGWKADWGAIEDFRFKDYVEDAVALLRYLRDSGKFSRTILVGHSEGGLVAILTAQHAPPDRLVLLASAARRQGDLLTEQLSRQLPPGAMKATAGFIEAIMAGRIVDPVPPDVPPPLAFAPSAQPGLASAFAIDPIPPLKSLGMPILIAAGGRDRQVGKVDFEMLKAAAPMARTVWLPEMNHVLNDVGDDADDVAAYNQPERALDAALINSIATFVLEDGLGR